MNDSKVTTVHGTKFDVVPGKTVIVYRNGFCNDVKHFESTYDRDQFVQREKVHNRSLMATSHHYKVR